MGFWNADPTKVKYDAKRRRGQEAQKVEARRGSIFTPPRTRQDARAEKAVVKQDERELRRRNFIRGGPWSTTALSPRKPGPKKIF